MTSPYTTAWFTQQTPTAAAGAAAIVPRLVELVKPTAVIDIGCGTGAWLAAFVEAGIVDVVGVDGGYLDTRQLLIPESAFMPRDLRSA